jgi:hypothetical protein
MTSRRLFRLSYLDRLEERVQQKRTVSVGTLRFETIVDDTRELDTQLRILQSVAAHMKLLLDTPEHIWRLLEKKKYLHAGWLFLLARIIYQALVRTDTEDEEDDWRAQGIDVPVCSTVYGSSASAYGVSQEQFPLVQRQWDTVAQFRAQITYKATLSLRDSGASLEVRSSHILVLDFWPTCAPGCLLYSVDDPSPRISAADRRIDNISHATSKDLAVNPIAKPKICSQWIFTERQCLAKIQKSYRSRSERRTRGCP